jgi:hypothetical protein
VFDDDEEEQKFQRNNRRSKSVNTSRKIPDKINHNSVQQNEIKLLSSGKTFANRVEQMEKQPQNKAVSKVDVIKEPNKAAANLPPICPTSQMNQKEMKITNVNVSLVVKYKYFLYLNNLICTPDY